MNVAAEPLFHCALTMRRLAHDSKREALMWEKQGNLKYYQDCRKESDRFWENAKFYLSHARMLNNG